MMEIKENVLYYTELRGVPQILRVRAVHKGTVAFISITTGYHLKASESRFKKHCREATAAELVLYGR